MSASASPHPPTAMAAYRPKQLLPISYQYISIINTHQTDLVVLSRPKSNPQTTTIQFFSSKSLGTGESVTKYDVRIPDVLDLAWFSPLDTFALLTRDTIYLYNLKSNTEKYRHHLAEANGQSSKALREFSADFLTIVQLLGPTNIWCVKRNLLYFSIRPI